MAVDLSALITALQNPEIYPDHPERVEVVQTHVSAIFLTGRYVYKVKKPVDFGFLDFTTLEKRKFFCHREVELNRRLCPEVYLGVVEIFSPQGRISLKGPGEVVEYAVLMKQLPRERMMDQLLARGVLTPSILQKIAGKIAHFHAQAATSAEIASFGGVDVIRGNAEENFSQTEKYVSRSISPRVFDEIKENTRRFMQEHLSLFEARIAAGRVRDCHGDLHLQHICLTDEILIFDCIEFNQRFRYSDVAADIAFLLMDLDFHGYPLLSATLASDYLALSRDWPLFELLDFYKSYRAYVRGKVVSFRLDDPAISSLEKNSALEEARRYFQLAHHYAMRLRQQMLLVTCGLVGTGKSTIARALSGTLGWELMTSDILRKELADLSPREHRYEKFHRGIYAPEFSRKTYGALFERAEAILKAGHPVLIDASFKKTADRQQALELARRTGAEFLLIECRCSEMEIQRRLARRASDEKELSDGRWELYGDQQKDFEKVEEMEPDLHVTLNTESSVEKCLEGIFRHLLRRAGEKMEAARCHSDEDLSGVEALPEG